MEFDELQQIWDAQNNQPLYVMNENALHNRIMTKLKQARHITNTSELLLIIINLGAGSFVLWLNLVPPSGNVFMYGMAAWMLATALYLLVSRIRRIKRDHIFDRSMHGDLAHALSVATYQVRLSRIMLLNSLPIGAFCLLGAGEGRKLLLTAGLIGVSFVLAFYVGSREQRHYKARKRELEILQNKLEAKG